MEETPKTLEVGGSRKTQPPEQPCDPKEPEILSICISEDAVINEKIG